MKVIEIKYNWHQAGSTIDRAGCGEDWSRYTVSEKGVLYITEHLPCGDGDRLYYDVYFIGGTMERIFNPCNVKYESN